MYYFLPVTKDKGWIPVYTPGVLCRFARARRDGEAGLKRLPCCGAHGCRKWPKGAMTGSAYCCNICSP